MSLLLELVPGTGTWLVWPVRPATPRRLERVHRSEVGSPARREASRLRRHFEATWPRAPAGVRGFSHFKEAFHGAGREQESGDVGSRGASRGSPADRGATDRGRPPLVHG